MSGFSGRRMLKGTAATPCCRCFVVLFVLSSQFSFAQAGLGDWSTVRICQWTRLFLSRPRAGRNTTANWSTSNQNP